MNCELLYNMINNSLNEKVKEKLLHPEYECSVGKIKLNRILDRNEYEIYKDMDIELIVAYHIDILKHDDDCILLAKEFNVLESILDKRSFAMAFVLYGGYKGMLKKFRNEIMSNLIKRMLTEKEIYEMYKLILTGKIN